MMKKYDVIIGLVLVLMLAVSAQAQTLEQTSQQTAELRIAADTVWTLITAMLVFFMNAGFATLESGLCRAKNAVNILAKNLIVFAISSLAFWIVGFGFMFADGNSLIGLHGWFLSGADNSPAKAEVYSGVFSSLNWTGVPLLAKFFFQLVFAGTAATIVSGAVAERIKFISFIVFSYLMVGVIYPVFGHWAWGGGWLSQLGFHDFAGSTVVHSVGGWAALMGAIFLGPRIGKYNRDGTANAIPAHNMGLATLGTFILWVGWFGFNPGSTMAADWAAIAKITVNTNMAACAGAFSATVVAWMVLGKPDLSMILNGTLAGLVAITASCDDVTVMGSVAIGIVAGALVVAGVLFFDRRHVDDPVGALSVHLINGVWGTFAYGLFSTSNGLFYGAGAKQALTQVIGILGCGALVVVISSLSWWLIKATIGLRVTEAEEMDGLDIGEHGIEAYHGLAQTSESAAGG
ncbi:MAG: ammonium transporter [Acidobacteria bacterium]|nr:ammonium transporter [Acidobacteriota bacterium]